MPFMVVGPQFFEIKHAVIEVAHLGSEKITEVFFPFKLSH